MLTLQEGIQLLNPVLRVVLVVLLVPDQGAVDARLGWSRSEAQTRRGTDAALFELVFRVRLDQGRRKQEPQRQEEYRQDGVEDRIEEKNFPCKSESENIESEFETTVATL